MYFSCLVSALRYETIPNINPTIGTKKDHTAAAIAFLSLMILILSVILLLLAESVIYLKQDRSDPDIVYGKSKKVFALEVEK